jgi:hypothetical protein
VTEGASAARDHNLDDRQVCRSRLGNDPNICHPTAHISLRSSYRFHTTSHRASNSCPYHFFGQQSHLLQHGVKDKGLLPSYNHSVLGGTWFVWSIAPAARQQEVASFPSCCRAPFTSSTRRSSRRRVDMLGFQARGSCLRSGLRPSHQASAVPGAAASTAAAPRGLNRPPHIRGVPAPHTSLQHPLLQHQRRSPLARSTSGSSTPTGGSSSGGGGGGGNNGNSSSSQQQQQNQQQQQSPSAAAAAAAASGSGDAAFLKPVYLVIFTVIFLGGLLFASMSLQLTSDLNFGDALTRITRRVFRSIAFRQLVVIAVAIFLVRFALNNVLRVLAKWSSSPVPWDKSKLYYVMKEVGGR